MLGLAPAPARLVSVTVPGPAGGLEALLRVPDAPAGAAAVAHPHPLHGGTMHTKVVHRAARLLSDRFRLTALRFNFRGVGASKGTHDEGRGEVEDLVAAALFARERERDGPFVLGGFSFGSICALKAAPRVSPDVLLLIGVPFDREDLSRLVVPDGLPVVWVQGELDGFGEASRARTVASTRGWEVIGVPGADHFFSGRLDAFEAAAGEGLARALPAPGRIA